MPQPDDLPLTAFSASLREAEADTTPRLTPHDQPPGFVDHDAFREELRRAIPAEEHSALADGRALYWVRIDHRGVVLDVRAVDASDESDLHGAVADVFMDTPFEPAQMEGEPIGVWVQIPARL